MGEKTKYLLKYVYNKDRLYQFYLCKFGNLSVLYLKINGLTFNLHILLLVYNFDLENLK
jgi:hypothetical protein